MIEYDYNKLNCNPLFHHIETELSRNNSPLLIIVPFIKKEPLKKLINKIKYFNQLKIIVRWLPKDIINGVSDLSIFGITQNYNIPLYINHNIHLKLFVYNHNTAYHTSGNITKSGLGLINNYNVELGCKVKLTNYDWNKIYNIISSSLLVDNDVYGYYKEKLDCIEKEINYDIQSFDLSDLYNKKEFSIDSLPAVESPIKLFNIYDNLEKEAASTDTYNKAIHDIILYDIDSELPKDEFYEYLGDQFTSQKFINEIVDVIKKNNSMRFGEVTEWVQNNCSDVPVPYRWEIKKNTKVLYNWLTFFYDKISCRIPGEYSQVLYWNKKR